MAQRESDTVQVLRFENVRPPTLTLNELLGGRVTAQVVGEPRDVPAVVAALVAPELPSPA